MENITYEKIDRTAVIRINRPAKMNALNIQTIQEIGQAHQNALADAEISAIILTGSGEKAFAAGADIAEFASFTAEEGENLSRSGQQIFRNLELSPKPVIAAVNGFALGGGCELAMSCQIRIASTNAKFGQPEVNLGLIPGYAGTQRLVRYIGTSQALELLLTGDMINAEKAQQLGLVNRVVELADLLPAALEIADKISTKSALNIAQIVALVDAYNSKTADGFDQEAVEFGKCFATADFKEGTTAFLEKRKPSFTGK